MMPRHAVDSIRRYAKAQDTIKRHKTSDVKLVQAVYNSLINLAINEWDGLSDDDFNYKWEYVLTGVSEKLFDLGLISRGVFYSLWDACDALAEMRAVAQS